MPALTPLRSQEILVWGEPTHLTSLQLSAPLERDTSLTASASSTHAGGSALAACVGISDADRLAGRSAPSPQLWGPFAADAEGEWIIDQVRSTGVELHPLRAVHSRRSIALVEPGGARTIVGVAGDAFTQPYADLLPEDSLAAAGLLHLSLASVLKDTTGALERLLRRARTHSLPWTLDLGLPDLLAQRRAEIHALLALHPPQLIFGNELEVGAAGLYGTQLSSLLVLKRGSAPTACIELASGELCCELAPPQLDPAAVVDTTGAGDALAGGLLAAWRAGAPLGDALAEGQRLAARVIQRTGTTLTL